MIGIRPVQGRLQLTYDPDPIPKVYPTANLCKKLLTCGKMQSNLDPINQLVPRKSALAPVRIITRYYAHTMAPGRATEVSACTSGVEDSSKLAATDKAQEHQEDDPSCTSIVNSLPLFLITII